MQIFDILFILLSIYAKKKKKSCKGQPAQPQEPPTCGGGAPPTCGGGAPPAEAANPSCGAQ